MNTIEFLRLCVDFAILRREKPFVLGLAITDICNLACRHCKVANQQHVMMSYGEVRAHLESGWRRGARVVYFEGGEPYLWHDGRQRLDELVVLARDLGYLGVHVYTNGTHPISAPADFTWVSIDGPDDTNFALRGVAAEVALANLAACRNRCGIVFTVNTVNQRVIEPFLRLVRTRLPKLRVMFFFHTPYYGMDELFLSPEQRAEVIRTIVSCKKAGLPVMNSKAGLEAMLTGRYPHPTGLYRVVDSSGDYRCCRAIDQPGVCRHCGYSSCAEIMLARDLRPGPIRSVWHTW